MNAAIWRTPRVTCTARCLRFARVAEPAEPTAARSWPLLTSPTICYTNSNTLTNRPAETAKRCAACSTGSIANSKVTRMNAAADSPTLSGILATAPWSVRQLVMSLSRYAQTRRLHVEAGVHVRLTESLNASCTLHLELSGSRAKPTAARRGVTLSSPLPLRGYGQRQQP